MRAIKIRWIPIFFQVHKVPGWERQRIEILDERSRRIYYYFALVPIHQILHTVRLLSIFKRIKEFEQCFLTFADYPVRHSLGYTIRGITGDMRSSHNSDDIRRNSLNFLSYLHYNGEPRRKRSETDVLWSLLQYSFGHLLRSVCPQKFKIDNRASIITILNFCGQTLR